MLTGFSAATLSSLYNYLGVSTVIVAHKRKPTGSASAPLTGDIDIPNIPILLKQGLQILLVGPVGQIVNPEGDHIVHIGRRSAVLSTFRHVF